jgi:hypothetical protein
MPSGGLLELVRTVGEADGPDMLFSTPWSIESTSDGGLAVADGRQLLVVGAGRKVGIVGRRGRGPAEYTSPWFTRVDPSGLVWLFDQGNRKALAYNYANLDSVPSQIDLRDVGSVRDAVFMPSGDLVVSALGATESNLGFRLHVLTPATGKWRSLLPDLRDRSFSGTGVEQRLLHPVGGERLAVIDPFTFTIQIVDMRTDQVVDVLRGDQDWWRTNAEALSSDSIVQYSPLILSVRFEPPSYLWVLASVRVTSPNLTERIDDTTTHKPITDSYMALLHDTVVEKIDLNTAEVLQSLTFEQYTPYLLSPGQVGLYTGDLPYPRIHIFRIGIR